MNGLPPARRIDLDSLQTRFALRVAARLSQRSEALPHDIAERLRVAREQAVQRARQLRAAAPAPAAAFVVSGNSVALGEPTSWWLRMASAMPLVMLVFGLVFIQHLHRQEEIHAAAVVDAALLADDLPPEAYRDPGFVAFLKLPVP
jgi:hypothetical protein